MINLLPLELKQSYMYARQNNSLLKLITAFGLGIFGLVLIVFAGFIYMQQSANNYKVQAANIEANLKKQKQQEIEKQTQDISNSLKLAVQVLSKEVLFSQVMQRLAVIVPSNVSLSSISLNDFAGGLDVSAGAVDYEAASQLQVNLADPANQIFSKADIVSITCETNTTEKYPCKVVVRALFTQNNSFQFISGKKAGS
jgi:Tfp pilus assembly protein PilN